MKISVIVATYNGEKYINEQLNSIINQTVKPDEILVFDDCSKDRTVNIVNEIFLKENNENYKVFINSVNKGFMSNFIEALKKVKGDIIFFSDQDDIFDRYKFEEMLKVFIEHKDCMVLNSRYVYINDKGEIQSKLKYDVDNFNGKVTKMSSIDYFFKSNFPGFAMAIRKEIVKQVLLYDYKLISGHDIYINMIGLFYDGCYLINKKLNYHRIHLANTTRKINDDNKDNISRKKQKKKELENLELLLKFLKREKLKNIDINFVEKKILCLKKRIYYRHNRKLLKYLFNLCFFSKYYPLKTLVIDLFVIIKFQR